MKPVVFDCYFNRNNNSRAKSVRRAFAQADLLYRLLFNKRKMLNSSGVSGHPCQSPCSTSNQSSRSEHSQSFRTNNLFSPRNDVIFQTRGRSAGKFRPFCASHCTSQNMSITHLWKEDPELSGFHQGKRTSPVLDNIGTKHTTDQEERMWWTSRGEQQKTKTSPMKVKPNLLV